MGKRKEANSKLTPEMRARLEATAAELRRLVDGEAGHPAWGTAFAEIEADAKRWGTS